MLRNMRNPGRILRRSPEADGKNLVFVLILKRQYPRAGLLVAIYDRLRVQLRNPFSLKPLIFFHSSVFLSVFGIERPFMIPARIFQSGYFRSGI